MEKFKEDMITNLYGNPHSASASSQLSSSRIEDTRVMALQFFNADPDFFDLVFVANATAGIKLVAEVFREQQACFNYGYHYESHTSLIGVRESAQSSHCWNDAEIESLVSGSEIAHKVHGLSLFGYPAQSNMNGRRFPLSWSHKIRDLAKKNGTRTYILLDASSLVSTAQLDLGNKIVAPDFTVLSFYKIFGFPDLGALILRRDSSHLFRRRKYFGGGTVDIVLCNSQPWHALKSGHPHESLEDGTLPTHSISALNTAICDYKRLYGSMDQVSRHTSFLSLRLFSKLSSLRHGNSRPVCKIYSKGFDKEIDGLMQGPIVAFNILDKNGSWISNVEFEKFAGTRKIHVRTGSLCSPASVASYLNLEPQELREIFLAGYRCGDQRDLHAGKIYSVIRVSLGAMSSLEDVDKFVSFVEEFFVDQKVNIINKKSIKNPTLVKFSVESLKIYPIKSCGGFPIPPNINWEVKPEGLAWDREWLLIHQGTGQPLSQKLYPKMALIRPRIDIQKRILVIECHGVSTCNIPEFISVPLSPNHLSCNHPIETMTRISKVCGDAIIANAYTKPEIINFFSVFLEVPCLLARFPAGGSGISSRISTAQQHKHQIGFASDQDLLCQNLSDVNIIKRPILLSNESPILMINRASVDHLNEQISSACGKQISASVFRANIVLRPEDIQSHQPYCEDKWVRLKIGSQTYQMLGSCRRCYMICIDQDTAERNEEPLVTLAKTRRFDSKVYFGCHMCHIKNDTESDRNTTPTIQVGDIVQILDADS